MAVRNPPSWQIDRHVPIALLFAMLVQTVGVVWWAASLTGRVSELERQVHAQGQSLAPLLDRAARFETRLEGLTEHVLEVKGLLRNSILTYMPPTRPEPMANPQKPALTR